MEYKYAPAKVVTAADLLIALKKKGDPWKVIEKIVEIWAATRPSEYKSFIVSLIETKSTRKATKVGHNYFSGVSKDATTGAYLSYKLDIPEKVIFMIRKLYDPDELPMDKRFYKLWAKRFPKMVIEQKL